MCRVVWLILPIARPRDVPCQRSPLALERGLGPWQATALNVANMVGIGPFITIPLFSRRWAGRRR